MPFAQIFMIEGRTEEQKRAVIEKVGQAPTLASLPAPRGGASVLGRPGDGMALVEAVNAPKETVRVWITDVPKTNWGIAGTIAKDLGR